MSKIFIIDDDIELVKILEDVIKLYFPQTEIYNALDSLDGIHLVRSYKPDLIILDLNLPSISGHEVCRTLKSEKELKKIPILIITGESSEFSIKAQSLECGADAFLKKPFDIPELVAQIKSLLRLKQAEDQLLQERDLLKIDVRLKEKELEKNYKDIQLLFKAFIEVMASSIDALSIYNYNSTRLVAEMVKHFLDFISNNYQERYPALAQDEERRENLVIAAWLHDIGKIYVPFRLMNKFTRLGDCFEEVCQRLETAAFYYRSENANEELINHCHSALELVRRLNNPQNEVTENDQQLLQELSILNYVDLSGKEKKWFTPYELDALSVKQGTLTKNERKEIENHVRSTDLLLSKIPFPPNKMAIREWCNNHHELLDGSGYYQGLKDDQISIETRILTIVDIFEALTSNERPYKKHYTIDQALAVLEEMADSGKLDKELVIMFKESKAWEVDYE